ncbi:MAG: hypothetical protein JJU00_17265 [Opitutales bacterium]|nr:hypothetical protein [Opitutales bacterium]
MKSRYKKFFFALVILPGIIVPAIFGTLVFPGWNLTPLRGFIASSVESRVEGLEFSFDEARLQLKRGTQLYAGIRHTALGQAGGERSLEVGNAEVSIPLRRLLGGRVMPERFDLRKVSVWLDTDESGIPVLPPWLQGLTETGAETADTTAWDQFRLSEIPLIWKITDGENARIQIRGYRAHLIRKGEPAIFSLPSLHINLDGRGDGVEITWRSGEVDLADSRYVAGRMRVNVPDETVDWENHLRLPLTPDLAAWLETGFPFLPVPSFLDTTAELRAAGRVELLESRMDTSGQLALAAGQIAPAGDSSFRLSLPSVTMDFGSDLFFGDGLPRLHSELAVRLGEGERASVVTLNARLDSAEDSLGMETVGALKYVEDILAIFPPALRPASITGDFSWDASLDTSLALPARIRQGSVALRSEGIELRFEGRPDQPLGIEPFTFAGKVEQSGNLINVAPFQFRMGPLAIDGSGFHWHGGGKTPGGTGTVSLRPFAVTDLIALIPRRYLSMPGYFSGWFEEVNVDTADVTFTVNTGEEPGSLIEAVTITPAWRLSIYGKPLTGGGWIRAGIPESSISIHLRAAEFNPAGMQLPGISAYADLDSEMTLSLRGDIDLLTMSGDLTAGFHAEPGWIHLTDNPVVRPGGAMPLHGISSELHLAGGLDHIRKAAGEFTLSAAPGQIHGTLAAAPFVLQTAGPEPLQLEVSASLQPRPTKEILHWIHPDAAAALPLPAELLHQVDLESARLQTELLIQNTDLGSGLTLSAPEATFSLRTGRESLRFTATGFSEADGSTRVVWSSGPWNPGRTGLQTDGLLPFSSGIVDVPLSFRGELHVPGNVPLHDPAALLSDLSIRAYASGENGYIRPNPLLDGGIALTKIEGRLSLIPSLPTVDTMLFVESGVGSLRVDSTLTLTPETAPHMRLDARWTSDLATVDTILDVLDLREQLPVWAQAGGFRGTADSTISTRGVLHDEWKPGDWPLEAQMTLRHVWIPLPDEATAFGHLDHEISVSWDGDALTTKFGGRLHQLRHGTAMSGGFGFEGTLSASAEIDTTLAIELDLEELATEVALVATNKLAGVPGSLRLELNAPPYPVLRDEPRLDLTLHLRNIFFDHLRFRAKARFSNGFADDWFGCDALDVDFFGMDYSDLTLSLRRQPAGSLSVRMESQTLNLAPAIELLEPLVLNLLGNSGGAQTSAEAVPMVATDASGGEKTAVPLPDVTFDATFERIQIGNIHSFGPVQAEGTLKGGLPNAFVFQATDTHHSISLAIDPPESSGPQSMDFRLSELGHWLDIAVSPLRLYQSERAAKNEMLTTLLKLPDSLDRGHLRFGGEFTLQPNLLASFRSISLGDLVLQTEIAFLNRIAALADRKVTILIPFKEFRIASIDLDEHEVTAKDIFMEGPINLALQSTNYSFANGNLHILGRVFGIPFEVIGIPPDLQFFLQERSPVIRALTVEDDFEW